MTSSAYFPKTTRLFSMKGRDARDFLHRLTTVNIRDMDAGMFKPGFFLSPQGKTRAYFRVACLANDAFLFEVEDGENAHWAKEFLSVIEQFTFAESYELEEKKGLKNVWIFALPKAGENQVETRGSLTLLHASREVFGTNWTSVWGPSEEIDSFVASIGSEVLSESEFERRRILSLFPRVDRELLPEANPLELGLRTAIDDNKGCYPGQEVIEKIISIGSPAKRLALVDSGTPFVVGSKLLLSEGNSEVGVISSVANDSGKTIGLALLRKNALEEGKNLKLENGSLARVEKIARYE